MSWIDQRYRCTKCGFEGTSDEWESKCIFWGSREEPPEWEAWCPDCGETWETTEEVDHDPS